jgi:predicted Zn-dependent peptidase
MMIRDKILLYMLLLFIPSLWAQQEQPPEGGEPKDFQLPQTETFALDNGLKVTLVQYGTLPKVNASLVIRAGNINEAENEIWLADLTTDYLKEGTTSKSAGELAEEAAKIGGQINTRTGMDEIDVSGESLADFAPELVALIADVAQHPLFPESELERLKSNMLRNLSVQKSQPQAIAMEKFREALNQNHPYGRIYPTEEMIKGYSLSQIQAFYDENFNATRAHLYLVGMFNADEVKQAVEEHFREWQSGESFEGPLPSPESSQRIFISDRPGAPQSTILMGLPVIDPSHQDYIDLQVTNALLGGAFSSRITSNIREDKGYTYSPRSTVSTRYRDAYWTQAADVSTDVTGDALKEIFYEINRLENEPPSKEELQGTQNYLAGIFVLRNSSRTGIISQLSFVDLHGLDKSYLTQYVERVHAVTPEDIQEVMEKYLDAGEMTIVLVGDVDKIRSQVTPYAERITIF